jgi:signal transduction histidine kinase
MTFALYDSSGKLTQREQVGEEKLFSQIDELASALKNTSKRIVVYDELSGSNSKLHLILQNLDVSVAVPLITKDGITGYLLLGPKLSGNIYTSQDIGVLGIAASELAVALQNAQRFEEIRDFNETLQDKITGATKELRSTNKKLVELDEAKDEFISMASHQLRTPLTSIKGYISMLIEGDLGKLNEQQKTALKEAFTSSQRMVFLIADFLNVSRIKTGKFVIEPKELDLSAMVKEELIQLKEMAESKHLELKYDPPHNFPTVMLDDNKMHQVMMNIVDNAIYYTPQGGTITIQLYENDKEIIFKVIDTGIGVPKTEQHKLFTKFYRAGNARKARPDGTGLGLYMAQKIIVEQGGSMIFESIEGKGSTFGFRFPLAKIKS